jgi:3-hydroxyacyl-CoA dehydrogenase
VDHHCSCSHPQPFELFDYVGIDVTQFVSEAWVKYAERGMLPMDLIKPSPLMTKMVYEDKTLGRKTGKGFFDVSSSTILG